MSVFDIWSQYLFGSNVMAASGSDDSSGAPANFNISSSIGGSDSHLNDSNPKCPLCIVSRRNFYCRNCVKSGDFVHSAHHFTERLCEKQQRYLNLKTSIKRCEERCEQLLQKRKLEENIKLEIQKKKERIVYLTRKVSDTKKDISTLTKYHKELKDKNDTSKTLIPKYEDKVQNLGYYVSIRLKTNEELLAKKLQLHSELKEKIRTDIDKLRTNIFPIHEVLPKQEPTDMESSVSETVAALAEATNTEYIRGKWVFQDSSNNELQHVIVEAALPANGDYSAYIVALSKVKENGNSTVVEIPSKEPAYRIGGALTYITQLINIMSFYLDVRLPFRVTLSDFCKKELNAPQFTRRVNRLNTNIMYLAYTQHVKLSLLNPTHTMENVLDILNTHISDLGRIGPVDVSDAPLVRSVDSQVMMDLDSDTQSESDDDNSFRHEWESVPHSPPHMLNQPPNSQQAASMAGGLMTSAAAGFASFLRGWTTGR